MWNIVLLYILLIAIAKLFFGRNSGVAGSEMQRILWYESNYTILLARKERGETLQQGFALFDDIV